MGGRGRNNVIGRLNRLNEILHVKLLAHTLPMRNNAVIMVITITVIIIPFIDC